MIESQKVSFVAGMCPASPALEGRVKGHNIKETTFPGSPALEGGELHSEYGSREHRSSH